MQEQWVKSPQDKIEPKGTKLGLVAVFVIVFLLALTLAACWYFFIGGKTKSSPETPKPNAGFSTIRPISGI
jgi:flagellar basal body-associated protein FliL